MTTLNRYLIVTAMACLLCAGTARAAVESYDLHNHPDGSENPPLYGLRLDSLNGDDSAEFTFNFDHALSAMVLDLTKIAGVSTEIHIYGPAYGGRDTGNSGSYDSSTEGVYDVDFTYTSHINDVTGGVVVAPHDQVNNTGSIIGPAGVELRGDSSGDATGRDTVLLVDQQKSGGNTFNFIGGTHRGYTGLNGWGWLSYDDGQAAGGITHINASDWLFTADEPGEGGGVVPEPTAVLVWSLLMGVALVYRRNR
jgi:hypothetical protein